MIATVLFWLPIIVGLTGLFGGTILRLLLRRPYPGMQPLLGFSIGLFITDMAVKVLVWLSRFALGLALDGKQALAARPLLYAVTGLALLVWNRQVLARLVVLVKSLATLEHVRAAARVGVIALGLAYLILAMAVALAI